MYLLSSNLLQLLTEGEFSPQDDIDRLFEKLHKLEPPGDIVKQILTCIKRLPAPQPQADPLPEDTKREAAE